MPAHIIGELQFGLASVCLVCPFTENKHALVLTEGQAVNLDTPIPQAFPPPFLYRNRNKKKIFIVRETPELSQVFITMSI